MNLRQTTERWPWGQRVALAWFVGIAAVVTGAPPALADDVVPPTIVHEGCAEYQKGKPFEIIARFDDDSALFDPKLYYRNAGESHWKQLGFTKMPKGDNFRAALKVKELKGSLEYFIEVFDEYGNGPARLGSPEEPIRVDPSRAPDPCEQVPEGRRTPPPPPPEPEPAPAEVELAPVEAAPVVTPVAAITTPPPPPAQSTCEQSNRPVYCEPWLWGVVGAVAVVGGGVGVYLLLSGSEEAAPQRQDAVMLNVTGPDPTAIGP